MTNGMDLMTIAATLFSERPSKRTKYDGVGQALWAKWSNVVDAFAMRVGRLDERAAFRRACGADEEKENGS